MFDFGALEKAQATVDPVGNAGVEQRRLDDAALGVAAIEHRHFLAPDSIARQLAHFLDHPLRLGKITGRLADPNGLARPLVGAQVLAQPLGVVADQRVGAVEDVAVTAVVLLELDLMANAELADEVRHIANPRTAKGVDALVVVADRQHAARRMEVGVGTDRGGGPAAGEHLDPGVLQLVGVLKFVDQDVAKAPLVMLADRRVVTQHLVAAQHQLCEVNHALALALFLIELVNLDLLAGIVVAQRDHLRPHPLLLAAGDEPLGLLGRKALVVDSKLLHQPLDRRQLVLRVEDLEALRQIGHAIVRAQEPVAQPVEGADPHAARIHRQHRCQARHHLLGSLVGESHCHHAAGRNLARLQQPGDARRQHAGLARARAREDERVLARQRDRGALLRVKLREQRAGRVGFWKHRLIVGTGNRLRW